MTVYSTGRISYISTVKAHQEESAADLQSDDGSVPGDTAACCSVSEISI